MTAPAPMWASSAALAACGQALVDREGGVAAVPHVAQRVDERRAAGQVDGDEAAAQRRPARSCVRERPVGAPLSRRPCCWFARSKTRSLIGAPRGHVSASVRSGRR